MSTIDASSRARIRFAVLDLVSEDAMDLFEVRNVARRAAPGLSEAVFEDALEAAATDLLREGLVELVSQDGAPMGQATVPPPPAWRYDALAATSPRLAITAAGRAAYRGADGTPAA